MSDAPLVIARAATPEGHDIALTAMRWAKIIEGHPEMVDHREPDVTAGRERMFRRGGPERWIRVVIDVDHIVTAFAQTNDPVQSHERADRHHR